MEARISFPITKSIKSSWIIIRVDLPVVEPDLQTKSLPTKALWPSPEPLNSFGIRMLILKVLALKPDVFSRLSSGHSQLPYLTIHQSPLRVLRGFLCSFWSSTYF